MKGVNISNYDIPLHQGSSTAFSDDGQFLVVGSQQSTIWGGSAFVYKFNQARYSIA